MTAAVAMNHETRINLAFLERFVDEMAESPHGSIYLRMLAETAEDAVEWALGHCEKVTT